MHATHLRMVLMHGRLRELFWKAACWFCCSFRPTVVWIEMAAQEGVIWLPFPSGLPFQCFSCFVDFLFYHVAQRKTYWLKLVFIKYKVSTVKYWAHLCSHICSWNLIENTSVNYEWKYFKTFRFFSLIGTKYVEI